MDLRGRRANIHLQFSKNNNEQEYFHPITALKDLKKEEKENLPVKRK